MVKWSNRTVSTEIMRDGGEAIEYQQLEAVGDVSEVLVLARRVFDS